MAGCKASSPRQIEASTVIRVKLTPVVLSGLLCIAPAACLAQADAPVPRPEVRVGERWTYNIVDYWSNRVTATREWVVSTANERAILTVVTEQGKPETDESFTPEWNGVATTIATYLPDTGLLRFPLRPGARYTAQFEMVSGPQRNLRSRHDREIEVLGWEEIAVPAGRFRALKIVAGGSFQRLDTSIAGTVTWTFWYAPEVKRWVKIVIEDNILIGPQRGPFSKFGAELVKYAVQ
jgi:hypothetical protein